MGAVGAGSILFWIPGFDFFHRHLKPFEHVLLVGLLVVFMGEVQAEFVDDLGALPDPVVPGDRVEVTGAAVCCSGRR